MKIIKQKILSIFLLFLIIIPMGTPLKTEAKTSSDTKIITLNQSYYVLSPKKRVTLRPTIHKAKYRSKIIIWTSSDKSVAKVSSRGSVLGKKKGKATITALISGTKYKATCKVVVGVPAKSIKIPTKECKLTEGKSYQIKAILLPSNATKKSMTYLSSKPSVATVTSTGKIAAVSPGKTTITILSKDGNQIKNTISVTVSKKTPPVTDPIEDNTDHGNTQPPENNNSDNENTRPPENSNSGNENTRPPENSNSGNENTRPPENSNSGDNNTQPPIEEQPKPGAIVTPFMELMQKYTAFMKQYGSLFVKDTKASAAKCTYAQAKANVENNIIVKVNCTFPYNWALQELGILPSNAQIYGSTKGFIYKSKYLRTYADFQNKMYFLYYDSPVQYSVQDAAQKGMIMKGDILSITIERESGNINHSVVYAGMSAEGHAMVYEAGGLSQSAGYGNVGCGPLDYAKYSNYMINEVIRLK